jgi:hypothetical protein
MKKILNRVAFATLLVYISQAGFSQKNSERISPSELESHVSFLASPLLKGRMNGEEGLDLAAQYLASQAQLTGLKPANGKSYFQPYSIIRKAYDEKHSGVMVISGNNDTTRINEQLYHLLPQGPADIDLQGDVVFAGYGIKSDEFGYNDLEGIDIKGKIVLVMERAPLDAEGKVRFNDPELAGEMSFQPKIGPLLNPGPKAVIFVPDPKSGHKTYAESSPMIAGYLSSQSTLKGETDSLSFIMSVLPKIIFVNRSVADALLKGTGKTLEGLQNEIDRTLKPQSFAIEGKQLIIKEKALTEEKTLNNVAAYIEGSDPVLKKEVVVFSAHYDHIGSVDGYINPGADDDASGCAALLSMADAFSNLKKKPLRSILFLWVSGEEIGLFGSSSYVKNPLFPLEKTVADLNMDMIGRIKSPADSTSETPMSGPDDVFLITDNQSNDLRKIADEADSKSPLNFDYSLSGINHPLQLFARSDHFNFVKKDIPILFFTTGLHSDYHSPRDVIEKLNFNKMALITKTMYSIGYTVANRKERIVVDNPYTSWGKE